MPDLIERLNNIKKKPKSEYSPGYVDRVFEYHIKAGKNYDNSDPVFIKPEPVESKKKNFIN
mgnify:FL=1